MPQPRQHAPLLGKARQARCAGKVRVDQLDRHGLRKAPIVTLGTQHLPHAAPRNLARHAVGSDPLGHHVGQAKCARKAGGLEERRVPAVQCEQLFHPRPQCNIISACAIEECGARARIVQRKRFLDDGQRAGVLRAHTVSP